MRTNPWMRAAAMLGLASALGCSWILDGDELGGGGAPDGGAPPLCTSASGPPAGTRAATSQTFSGCSFLRELGAPASSASAWSKVGYDLDGRCTASTSTDVCAPPAATPAAARSDGVGGIDNSYGRNVCPFLEAIAPDSCSGGVAQLRVDASGNGILRWASERGGPGLVVLVSDVYVRRAATGGTVGGVMLYSSLLKAWKEVRNVSFGTCTGEGFTFLAATLEQAQDLLRDGTNKAGVACDGVSFGFTFTAASPFSGSIDLPNNCP